MSTVITAQQLDRELFGDLKILSSMFWPIAARNNSHYLLFAICERSSPPLMRKIRLSGGTCGQNLMETTGGGVES